MNIVASVEKERNDLVHGVFGGSMLVERGILWASQKNSVAHTINVWASDYQNVANSSENLRRNTYVYEPEDLETVAQKLEWLHDLIGKLRGYFSSDSRPWRAERYRQLCAEPHLARELSRMRADRKKLQNLLHDEIEKGSCCDPDLGFVAGAGLPVAHNH